LNGDIEEEIYMKQPVGFENGKQVCRLKKSLYGLKQSARAWNKVFNDVVVAFGFVQSEVDRCLYSFTRNNDVCYLIVHVDDILVASNNENLIGDFKYHLGKYFEMKDMGNVKHFLGIDVNRDKEGNFSISQSQYIGDIVENAGLNDGKISKFPLMTGYFRHHDENYLESNDEYRKLIGKLLYISTNTRPDIAAAVGILSQKVSNPTQTDYVEVRRVIRYLNGTKDLQLKLSDKKSCGQMDLYSDASWAEDPNERKSITGYCCRINGGTVSWCSRKQDVISLSSMESEYIALSECCKEFKWVKMLMNSFDKFVVPGKVLVYTDSQSSMKFIANQKFSNRSKHIDTKYHYVKNLVESREIELKYCSTDVNVADMLTKPLGAIKLNQFRSYCGLMNHH
jgi:Reverse transcriptase (RNA-dependent DNA polymerase)